MRVLTAEQMREVDRKTIEEIGIPSIVLMENAGHQVASAMHATISELTNRRVGVLCGRGNNGGDGLVLARVLWQEGIEVCVFLFGRVSEVRGDAGANLSVVQNLGLSLVEVADSDGWDEARSLVEDCNVLVDAIFGTGLTRPLDDLLTKVVADVNSFEIPIVAVDLPSGLSASHIEPIGEAIEADLTVALATPKAALLLPPAKSWAGELVIADIGIPSMIIDEVPGERLELLTPEEVHFLIPPRSTNAHKGDFGHVLVVAGSVGKAGAARLAGLAALRSGAGLVTVATPRACLASVSSSTPEYMTLPLAETGTGTVASDALSQILSFPCDVIAVGPGLGTGQDVAEVVHGLVERAEVPLVLDADALNVFGDEPDRLKTRDGLPIVMTPHPGEMARLCQTTSGEVQADRLSVARQFAADHELFVVLKGSGTVIANPDGTVWLNLTGNAGMATAGVGDVLTGVIAAWLGQLGRADIACQIGVFLHGLAGDLAVEEQGEVALTATDLIGLLGRAERETAKPST